MEHYGGAGHSSEIIKKLTDKGTLIGIDKDEEALMASRRKLEKYKNVIYIHNNHDKIKEILNTLHIKEVDGILLDLGISSYQIDEKERGFSYMADANLDMRMDKNQELTAWQVVNEYKEETIADILFNYGEEKFSRAIARNIVLSRKKASIDTTKQLVEIIEKSIPGFAKTKNSHPAKKTFQAIRIEVNNEIRPLEKTVKDCIESLKSGGRLCIITFHSLEDRAVKKAFIESEGKCTCLPDLPYCVCNKKKLGEIITKKPIIPTEKEKKENPRSKGAKLRIFEKR